MDTMEEQLSRLRPADPPEALMTRLYAAAPVRRGHMLRLPAWAAPVLTAAAAVVVVAFVLARQRTQASPDVARAALRPAIITPSAAQPPQGAAAEQLAVDFFPIAAHSTLLGAAQEGVLQLPDHPPVRVIRLLWMDEAACASSDRPGQILSVREPRVEIVPVSLPVF